MKQPWWALLVVAVLGAGAGVGVAVAVGDDPSTDSSDLLDPGSVASVGGATTTATTTAAPTTTTTPASTSSTTTPASTSTTTTTEPDPAQPPLDDITIVIANGADTPGLAGDTADLLRTIGYPNVEAVDGSEIFGATVLYVRVGLEAAGNRVISDIQFIDPAFVSPAFVVAIDESPRLVPGVPDADIVVYIGTNAP